MEDQRNDPPVVIPFRRPPARRVASPLLDVCIDELTSVAASTELRASLLEERLRVARGVTRAQRTLVEDLRFAASEMRAVRLRIMERIEDVPASADAPR